MSEKNSEETEELKKKLFWLSLKDLDEVYELDQICFPKEVAFPREFFAYLLSAPDCIALGIKSGKKLAGFIIAQAQTRYRAQLITLDIAPEQRRKGLASFLLDFLHRFLKERGFKKIRLEVAYNNHPAISLYQKHGYEWKGIRKKYYPDGTDAIIMEKSL